MYWFTCSSFLQVIDMSESKEGKMTACLDTEQQFLLKMTSLG